MTRYQYKMGINMPPCWRLVGEPPMTPAGARRFGIHSVECGPMNMLIAGKTPTRQVWFRNESGQVVGSVDIYSFALVPSPAGVFRMEFGICE